jgi:flagellar motility protein MotE (MotC chaperone)
MAIPLLSPIDSMQRAVLDALEKETKRIVEEEAQAAAARVVERVKGMTGEIAAKLASYVDYRQMQEGLVITVRFPDQKSSSP